MEVPGEGDVKLQQGHRCVHDDGACRAKSTLVQQQGASNEKPPYCGKGFTRVTH